MSKDGTAGGAAPHCAGAVRAAAGTRGSGGGRRGRCGGRWQVRRQRWRYKQSHCSPGAARGQGRGGRHQALADMRQRGRMQQQCHGVSGREGGQHAQHQGQEVRPCRPREGAGSLAQGTARRRRRRGAAGGALGTGRGIAALPLVCHCSARCRVARGTRAAGALEPARGAAQGHRIPAILLGRHSWSVGHAELAAARGRGPWGR